MNFTEAVESFFKNYATFTGRSSRSEYWYAFLFLIILGAGLGFIEGFLGLFPYTEESVLAIIAQVFLLVPSIAIIARRFHDINMSGWWYLIAFTIIGLIPVIYWLCKAGDEDDNKYGSNPLNKGD
tara:strand:+ start:54 stop:428 length:375 start_codon:yes stop_codon:yes gene_type:complete